MLESSSPGLVTLIWSDPGIVRSAAGRMAVNREESENVVTSAAVPANTCAAGRKSSPLRVLQYISIYTMTMKFDWDEKKAEQNVKAHDVSFDEAEEAFFDPNALEFYDPDHSSKVEQRYNLIGLSSRRLLFVVYTELENKTIWLISARKAEAKHRETYENK